MFLVSHKLTEKHGFFPKMDQKIDRSEIFEFWSKDLLKLLQLSNFQPNRSKNGFSRAIFLFWPILAPKMGFLPISPIWVDRFQKYLRSETSLIGPTFSPNLVRKLKIRAGLSRLASVKAFYFISNL